MGRGILFSSESLLVVRDGEADNSMIADSVSKAASGGDLGVDDTRFEELMADIDDDEDDFLGGGEKVSKRVSPLFPSSSSS